MARAGGPSTAAGVSFQALAIARAIIDVYQGRAKLVRAEVPPNADFGAGQLIAVAVDDFVVERDGVRVYHQAKSNAPGGGSWTVSKLWREEIIQKFAAQVDADQSAECCLLTPADCPLLGEVAERAKQAASLAEFRANLVLEHGQLVDELTQKLGSDDTRVFQLLRHWKLKCRSSEQLREDLEGVAAVLFADARAAHSCLHTIAIHAMETGQELNQATIAEEFAKSAVFTKPKASEVELISAVKAASSRLRTVARDIAGVHVPRPTVDELLKWIVDSNPSEPTVAALLDQAGTGKTVAMSVLLERVEQAGLVVLAIKVDGLAFSNQEELASAVGLPDGIPSVLQSLQAGGRRVALLIDQVDALSSAMSQQSSGIVTVLDLVARLADLRIPIVLACRSFDWKYDHRLQHLRERQTAEFSLPELSDDELTQVLSKACGVALQDLHPLTIRIVRCPLRLKVLVEVIRSRRRAEPAWTPTGPVYTLQSLYQEFWSLKMNKALSDGINTSDCEHVVDTLADAMHESEQLAAPEAVIADRRQTREWLISEGILDLHGKRVSFFHQTFFDFVFARRFVAQGNSLLEQLLASDQGLFYRPMVRQMLEYLRDANPPSYMYELRAILEDRGIRSHLRWLAVACMGQLRDPQAKELGLLEPMLTIKETRGRVLAALAGNAAWFDMLTIDRFDRWLRTLAWPEVWPVLSYLRSVISVQQQAVVSLLLPHIGESDDWNNQIAFSLTVLKSWTDGAADLLCATVGSDRTSLDGQHGWWASALQTLAKALPVRACEAIGIVLDRFRQRWSAQKDEDSRLAPARDGLLPCAHGFGEALSTLAVVAPANFLKHTLPWTLSVMQISCYSSSTHSFRDNWRYWRTDRSLQSDPTGRLLQALRLAAQELARADPPQLRSLVPQALASQVLPMQMLVAEAYQGNAAEFAVDAADFLASDPRRLRLTSAGGRAWESTQLIKACCGHWTKEDFRRVESAILQMRHSPTKSVDGLRWRGTTHLMLLQALDRSRLSAEGLNRLGQLDRKFPEYKQARPHSGALRSERPPVSGAVSKMDDDSWLGAMRKHVQDWESSLERPSCGRFELTSLLRGAAKQQPQRFFRLAMRIDQTIHIDYLLAIISGIAEAGVPVLQLEELIRKSLSRLEAKGIRTVASAVARYAESGVPESVCDLLREWARNATDPPADSEPVAADAANPDRTDELIDRGINSDRGEALWNLAMILLKADPPRRKDYLDVAEMAVADVSGAVRAVAIHFLPYATSVDPARACQLFRHLVGGDSRLLLSFAKVMQTNREPFAPDFRAWDAMAPFLYFCETQ